MIEKRMTCSRSAIYRSDYQLASPLYYTVYSIYIFMSRTVLYCTISYNRIVRQNASHRIASYHTQFTQRIQVYE